MGNERSTDQFVRDMLREIGFERPWEQSCSDAPKYIYEALEGASKGVGGGRGKPEFVIESGGFIVVVEDKAGIDRAMLLVDGKLDLDFPARSDYALNGAVHYARIFAERTGKRVFAVGVAGAEIHHDITVAFVEKGAEPVVLAKVDTLTDLAEDSIVEYHRVAVLGELPREEREVREIRKVAAGLHEDMRNYASLEGERKATLVSAILLALKYQPSLVEELKGEKKSGYTDGEKVYKAAKEYLEGEDTDFMPKQKTGALLDQFSFIKSHVLLNRMNKDLGNITPMRRFVEVLDHDVLHAVSDPAHSAFDVLGSFYGEFVKYGGSDGNSLGIVLTPHHVTELMAELIDVDSDDIVVDPAAGTAAFLIAAMHRMFDDARERFKSDPAALEARLDDVRRNRLHGIELQDKLFAIGTTNMILRGDGKANFQRHNFFDLDLHELRGDVWLPSEKQWSNGHGFTKALINPPYSQAKTKETRYLSELSFIERTLSLLNRKGRLVAIVPQSAMVGKTKEDKALKGKILAHHTLDAVITMNPDTFYGVGVNVVIAVFTAGVPHPESKKAAFINFKDDGYKVRQHVGLVGDGNEKGRRAHLLSVLNDGEPADTSFVVRSEVTADDEWQHSYFYFNDQPPTYDDFFGTVADYVSWQVDMHAHGLGDLISPAPDDGEGEVVK
ncbi:MAG: HsdM family class I SAM-dependent methyltransferase [Microcella sp.]